MWKKQSPLRACKMDRGERLLGYRAKRIMVMALYYRERPRSHRKSPRGGEVMGNRISVHENSEGYWLDFVSPTGKRATISVKSILETSGGIVSMAVRETCDAMICEANHVPCDPGKCEHKNLSTEISGLFKCFDCGATLDEYHIPKATPAPFPQLPEPFQVYVVTEIAEDHQLVLEEIILRYNDLLKVVADLQNRARERGSQLNA